MQQFSSIGALRQSVTEYLEQEVLEELHEEYGEVCSRTGISLADALRRIYAKTRQQFIILIDEWDCVMRERQESETLQRQYLDFLRNLSKRSALCSACLCDGHSASQKVRTAFCAEVCSGNTQWLTRVFLRSTRVLQREK